MPRRVLEGKVVSNKNAKTVTVLVERKVRDPLYGKIMRRSAKYAAHDETNQWNIGDQVSIEECRPLSRTKKWRVIGGKALGESQAVTVDEAEHKRASVKRNLEAAEAAKAPAKAEPKADAKSKPAKKNKKDE
jgi:small subunit ribosomal protein S17